MSRRNSKLRFESLEARQMLSANSITGDFNGDGYDDLAVGLPSEVVDGHVNAGIVQVTYGSSGGLDPGNRQNWDIFDILPTATDAAAAGAEFGHAVAAGDFNGDGYDDLAIGLPSMDESGVSQFGAWTVRKAGAVAVIYGSSSGLTAADAQFITHPGLGYNIHDGDQFGFALAAGDFDGNGFDDLAIGTPFKDEMGGVDGQQAEDYGVVNVIGGSSDGLDPSDVQLWSQDSAGIRGDAEGPKSGAFGGGFDNQGDNFGAALAVGDFNGDQIDDLAVGVPGEDLDLIFGGDHGAVNMIFGSTDGLTSAGNQFWSQDSYSTIPGGFNALQFHIEGGTEDWDRFGSSLIAGDFDGNGVDDLAVGVPGEDIDGNENAGAVNVIYGKSGVGLHAERNRMFDMNESPHLQSGYGGAQEYAGYGRALATADFDGDGRDDLAIGARGMDIGGAISAGLAHVIFSSPNGLDPIREAVLVQGHAGMLSTPEASDGFGRSLAAGNFDGIGGADLAIEVPDESYDGNPWDPGAPSAAGAMHIVYGPNPNLTLRQNELLFHHATYVSTGGMLNPGDRDSTAPFDSGSSDPTRLPVDSGYTDKEASGDLPQDTSSSPYTKTTKSTDEGAVDSYFAATDSDSSSNEGGALDPSTVDAIFAVNILGPLYQR